MALNTGHGSNECNTHLLLNLQCKLCYKDLSLEVQLNFVERDHSGAVVTHSPPASEVSWSNPRPYVGKLVVSYQWSAVYSREP